jgi:hypothetical protein
MATFFATADEFAAWLEKLSRAATVSRIIWRIVSAIRPETRERRLQELIKASSERRRL